MYIYIYVFHVGIALKTHPVFFSPKWYHPMADLGDGMTWTTWNPPRLLERLADLRVVLFSSGHRPRGAAGTGVGPWWALVGLDPPVGSHQKNPHEAGENHPPPKKKHHHLEAVYPWYTHLEMKHILWKVTETPTGIRICRPTPAFFRGERWAV